MYTEDLITKEFKKVYGKDAKLHEGQLEAIKAVLDGNRVLVVQKNWLGKKLSVFFGYKDTACSRKGVNLSI